MNLGRWINASLQGITLLGLELRRQRRDGSLIDVRPPVRPSMMAPAP